MRRTQITLTVLLLAVMACRAFVPAALPPPTVTLSPPTVTLPPPTSTLPPPTPTVVTTQPVPNFGVRVHPDGGLYVGDLISLEIIAPPDLNLDDEELRVQADTVDDEILASAGFAPFGIGGRYQATLPWVWDTAGLEAGARTLTFSIQPLGITWTHTLTLQAETAIPLPEPDAQWAVDESDCCLVHYITDTAADRDLQTVLEQADAQAEDVAGLLGLEFTEPIEVTLMPRVLGHGGFAFGDVYVSYLDRNYAGSSIETVLHHEMVHILDARLGGDLLPTILVEGLAVYLTGGHFKPESLIPRAAALLAPSDQELGLDWYLPLTPLTDNFYTSQHEIGYLQAGALVESMVETWGWEAFSAFYRDIHSEPDGKHSEALDAALRIHFDLTLVQLEARFIDALKQQQVTLELYDDVRLTVGFYDTVRRYQQSLDPSAYFLTVWLPDGPGMRERGIVADLVRYPSRPENLALETLLVTADEYLRAGRYSEMEPALEAVNAVLDARDAQADFPFAAHPLAGAHLEIVRYLLGDGYRVQCIRVEGNTAQVVVSDSGPDVVALHLEDVGGGWVVVNSNQ
ncbi:MAG: hypothetical protein ABIG63_19795 [Chloroflexota bacterium]